MNKNIILSLMFICMLSFTLATGYGYGYGEGYGTEEPIVEPEDPYGEVEETTPVVRNYRGGGFTEICEGYSVCVNGKQTNICQDGAVIKTRPCDSNITTGDKDGVYQELEKVVEVTTQEDKPITNGQPEFLPEEEEMSKGFIFTIIVVIILGIVLTVITFKNRNK